MQELKIKDIKRRFKNYEGRVGYEYPKNMFLFFEILSSTLSDTATLNELIFTIQLLVNDLEIENVVSIIVVLRGKNLKN